MIQMGAALSAARGGRAAADFADNIILYNRRIVHKNFRFSHRPDLATHARAHSRNRVVRGEGGRPLRTARTMSR